MFEAVMSDILFGLPVKRKSFSIYALKCQINNTHLDRIHHSKNWTLLYHHRVSWISCVFRCESCQRERPLLQGVQQSAQLSPLWHPRAAGHCIRCTGAQPDGIIHDRDTNGWINLHRGLVYPSSAETVCYQMYWKTLTALLSPSVLQSPDYSKKLTEGSDRFLFVHHESHNNETPVTQLC